MRPFTSVGALLALATLDAEPARAIPIDLNLFYADSSVVVAPDGSSATLYEDPEFLAVALSNDPSFPLEPNLIVPGTGVLLAFDYAFNEAFGGVDYFLARLFNIDDYYNALFEWSCDAFCSNSALLDLTLYDGLTLGLEFQLNSNPRRPSDGFPVDENRFSTLTISNLDVGTSTVSVDEPPTLALLSLGSLMLLARRRRRSTLP